MKIKHFFYKVCFWYDLENIFSRGPNDSNFTQRSNYITVQGPQQRTFQFNANNPSEEKWILKAGLQDAGKSSNNQQ